MQVPIRRVRRIAAAQVLLATTLMCFGAALLLSPAPPRGMPLWPGSRFTEQGRDHAVERGLRFLYQVAREPHRFALYGHDLLFSFANIAATSANPELRSLAWQMGHERALEWSRLHPAVPPDAGPYAVNELVAAAGAAAELGVETKHLGAALRQAAARFGPTDYYNFDPRREPPPADIPERCPRCGRQSPRGALRCVKCGATLQMQSRYDLWQDALISTYQGETFHVLLGARYADVLQWTAAMRPYSGPEAVDPEYSPVLYGITHLLYTFNGYNRKALARECWPDEFAFLRARVPAMIATRDAASLGECLDTLRAFGLKTGQAPVRAGVEYLLATQNRDGSWGDLREPDIYFRYHTTLTAIDGLREYRWQGTTGCAPAAQPPACPRAGIH